MRLPFGTFANDDKVGLWIDGAARLAPPEGIERGSFQDARLPQCQRWVHLLRSLAPHAATTAEHDWGESDWYRLRWGS